jgi:hypothetical protein
MIKLLLYLLLSLVTDVTFHTCLCVNGKVFGGNLFAFLWFVCMVCVSLFTLKLCRFGSAVRKINFIKLIMTKIDIK